MTRSGFFLSVIFTLAIIGVAVTKVFGQPKAFIEENDACKEVKRPEECRNDIQGQICVVDGVAYYQESSCLALFTREN
jgi:hypothetical protein